MTAGAAGAGGGMGGMGWAGLALQTGGNVAAGIGEGQALTAARRVWEDALGRQHGFDNSLDKRTTDFLASLSPELLTGGGHTQAIAERLDSSLNTAGKAVKARSARGGRKALPPGGDQRLADVLRSQGQTDGRDARLGGMNMGARDVGNLGDGYAGDRNRIIRDAHLWAGLVPSQLAAAAGAGGMMRGLGQTAQTFGGGLTNWAMSQPDGGPAGEPQLASTPGVAGVTAAQPQWQQPAQWQVGGAMRPSNNDLWGH